MRFPRELVVGVGFVKIHLQKMIGDRNMRPLRVMIQE